MLKICAAQFLAQAGDVPANVAKHRRLIELAASESADLVFFPELSLTGYEPTLARKLAFDQSDQELQTFQNLANEHRLTIGVGLPVNSGEKLLIGTLWYSPDAPVEFYGKQHVHADELPFFDAWERQLLLERGGKKLAPAICYESLLDKHAEFAADIGANTYLCSVAKDAAGVGKADIHYPKIAKQHCFAVLMANFIGQSDQFVSAGRSAVWNSRGRRLAQMDDESEGIVVFDATTDTATVRLMVD